MGGFSIKPLPFIKVKRAKIFTAIAVVLLGLTIALWNVVKTEEAELAKVTKEAANYNSLKNSVASLTEQYESKQQEFDAYTEANQDLMTHEKFLTTFSKMCDDNRLTMRSIDSGRIDALSDALTSITYKFEVKGSITDINRFVSSLKGLGINFIINDVTMHKDDQFSWLLRETMEISSGSWTDFALSDLHTGSKDPTSVADIYSNNNMIMYIDMSFLGINADLYEE